MISMSSSSTYWSFRSPKTCGVKIPPLAGGFVTRLGARSDNVFDQLVLLFFPCLYGVTVPALLQKTCRKTATTTEGPCWHILSHSLSSSSLASLQNDEHKDHDFLGIFEVQILELKHASIANSFMTACEPNQ